MREARRFIHNTILLTATSLLMRLLAMSFQVYLTRRIGAAGIGLFELLMSVYGLPPWPSPGYGFPQRGWCWRSVSATAAAGAAL